MGKMGKFDLSGMKDLQKNLKKLQDPDAFVEACAKELAARLLTLVVKATPVGDYSKEINVVAKRSSKKHKKGDVYKKRVNPSGKQGGTLRRGWISETHQEAESGKDLPNSEQILEYANGLQISRTGGIYKVEIINPVEYASYVEYGHRQESGRYVPALGKSLKQDWVKGHFMMTFSEQELQSIAPKILEKKIMQYLGGTLK